MTELHANNLNASLKDLSEEFGRAKARGNWADADKLWLKLLRASSIVISEARAARLEADALAAELEVYRPTRSDRPAAPPLEGYAYVFTAKAAWVCVAKELRTLVQIPVIFGGGYTQEHYAPERKTVCGKPTTYPVTERFTSGGWPRLHELCPDCTRLLVKSGVSLDASTGERAFVYGAAQQGRATR